jgi:hypothetical protein
MLNSDEIKELATGSYSGNKEISDNRTRSSDITYPQKSRLLNAFALDFCNIHFNMKVLYGLSQKSSSAMISTEKLYVQILLLTSLLHISSSKVYYFTNSAVNH